jgi:hypothetical protein
VSPKRKRTVAIIAFAVPVAIIGATYVLSGCQVTPEDKSIFSDAMHDLFTTYAVLIPIWCLIGLSEWLNNRKPKPTHTDQI